jgi:hypothetical protein
VRFLGNFSDSQQRVEIDDRIRGAVNVSISLEGQVPYLEAIRAMVHADLLLLLDTPGRLAGVPAKLYEYIGAGRPILALAEPESDVAWVLRESGVVHRIAPLLDPDAIRRALMELVRDPAIAGCDGRYQPGPSRFTRKHLAGELAAVLDSCLETPPLRVGDRSLSEAVR